MSRSLLALLLLGCGAAAARPTPPPRTELMRTYEAAAFEEAAREGRYVFLEVGIEGCTQCRRLHTITLEDPAVRTELSEHWIAISADGDVLPDVGGRYEPYGWPALAFFAPDGRELGVVQGFRAPAQLLSLLHAAREGTLDAAQVGALADPSDAELTALCRAGATRMTELADPEHGGTGRGFRVVLFEPAEWMFGRSEAPLRSAAVHTADGYGRLLDPVWGGVFVAAAQPDFTVPIVEKRTANEAWALSTFALAYRRTRDERYLGYAREVLRYLHEMMRSEDGLFFSTQDDAAPDLPEGMDARTYYGLGDEERRRYGVPPIDHATYTEQNALVIEALIALFEATGDAAHLEEARAMEASLAARIDPTGWIAQTAAEASTEMTEEGRLRTFAPERRPFTRAQGHMGRAWLALHRATGEALYLDRARAAADVLLTRLTDLERGGFWPAEPRVGTPEWSEPAYWDSMIASRFLAELVARLHDTREVEDGPPLADRYRSAIEPAIRRVAGSVESIGRDGPRLGLLVSTIETLLMGELEITVVAPPEMDAAAMLAAARAIDDPRRVVLREPPGRYPAAEVPTAYVCTALACSSPVSDPAALAATYAASLAALGDPCRPDP